MSASTKVLKWHPVFFMFFFYLKLISKFWILEKTYIKCSFYLEPLRGSPMPGNLVPILIWLNIWAPNFLCLSFLIKANFIMVLAPQGNLNPLLPPSQMSYMAGFLLQELSRSTSLAKGCGRLQLYLKKWQGCCRLDQDKEEALYHVWKWGFLS